MKEIQFPIRQRPVIGEDAAWMSAVSDIEHLRGMGEV
jgi:hypothetical protein